MVRALHDDPIWLWFLPDESKRARVLPWLMAVRVRYCHRYGEVDSTTDKVQGVALIRQVLARADAEGLPCYLESANPRNLPFYKRHGFEVVVEGELPGEGPPLWTMKREPVR